MLSPDEADTAMHSSRKKGSLHSRSAWGFGDLEEIIKESLGKCASTAAAAADSPNGACHRDVAVESGIRGKTDHVTGPCPVVVVATTAHVRRRSFISRKSSHNAPRVGPGVKS